MLKLKQSRVRKLISLSVVLLLLIIFSVTSDKFFTYKNIITILREASVVGIVAVGMTMVIITSGIDLSVGSVMAFVAMACINMIRFTSIPIPLIIAIGLVLGTVCGYITGIIVTKLRVPDFIASLASMAVFRGLALLIAVKRNGMIVSTGIKNPMFIGLSETFGGVYIVSIVFAVIIIVGHIIMKHTSMGVNIYAIGSNQKAALLSGIKSDKVKRFVFACSGFVCALGGIFTASRMRTATVELGKGFEIDVIAAVVVGGTSMTGGRGDMFGTMIGALFISVLDNGIRKFQIPPAYMTFMRGAIILLVVIFDAWSQKRYDTKLRRNVQQKKVDTAVKEGANV